MKSVWSGYVVIGLMLSPAAVNPQGTVTQSKNTLPSASTLTQSVLIPTKITESEYRQAQQWQLSDSEWLRYLSLRQGVSQTLGAENLSPLETLGIHADNESDRQRYAERWVQVRVNYARQSLAWMKANAAARERLFGGHPIIDESRLPGLSGAPESSEFVIGDRLMVFIRRDCSACEQLLGQLVTTLTRHAGIGLDIYFVDTRRGDDQAVIHWARDRSLPREWVTTKRVTLNHDNGLLASLIDNADVPAVLRRRGEDLRIVTTAELEN